MTVRSLVFRTIALLVVVNATAGIIVIANRGGQIGTTEANVLETTGLLSLGTLLLLPCVLAWEGKRMPPKLEQLPLVAAACLVLGFGLAIYLVWADPIDDTPAKVAATFGVAGGGLAHVCLLALLSLRAGHEWIRVLASMLTLALAAMLISAFWTFPVEGGFDDWKVRLFTVVAILAAASSLLAGLIERVAGPERRATEVVMRASYCPNCGAPLPANAIRCGVCGASFRIEFLDF